MPQYKYTWNNGGEPFSKWEWFAIARRKFHTINEPEESTIFRVQHQWEKHLKFGTIILSSTKEENFWEITSKNIDENIKEQQKGKEPIVFLLGCTYCHKIHACEGDGFPSFYISNSHISKATKQCFQGFNRRILKCADMA